MSSLKCQYFVRTVRELSNVRRNAMCMAVRQTGTDTARNARAVQCAQTHCAQTQCAQTQCAHSEEWQGSGLFGNYRQRGSRQVVSACSTPFFQSKVVHWAFWLVWRHRALNVEFDHLQVLKGWWLGFWLILAIITTNISRHPSHVTTTFGPLWPLKKCTVWHWQAPSMCNVD